ncbi:hypothetical protein D3C72_1637400 [compost metagenome]
MFGRHRLVRMAIPQTKLPAADIATRQGDGAEGLAACTLAALAWHHQQLALGHLGGAVVLPGQASEEIKIGLVELIRPDHFGRYRTPWLPAVARGNVGHDGRQRHVFPTATADGLAGTTHVTGLALDHQCVRRPGDLDLVDHVSPQAGQ